MKLTCTTAADLTQAFARWSPPPGTEEFVVDCPATRKFVNAFLGSKIDCRIRITPPDGPVNYAGLFSMCDKLSHLPLIDTAKAISLAAAWKGNTEMRYSVHKYQTANCRDFRQCFWGCVNFSGNGVQHWDFSSAESPDAFRHFFGGGSGMRTSVYNELILSLHRQMRAGTLPTPFSPVDFGASQYTQLVADEREELIRYGWDIKDGGKVEVDLSPLEMLASSSVDSRLTQGVFLADVDTSPICTTSRGGVMITPRHAVFVAHYPPWVNQSIRLRNGEVGQVERVDRHEMWDFVIATLKEPLNVRPAMVLPQDWLPLLPNAYGPPTHYPAGTAAPVVWFNQQDRIGVYDIGFAGTSTLSAQFTRPSEPARQALMLGIGKGDSGSPLCLVAGDRLIAVAVLQSSNGSGPWISSHRPWIDEVVARTGHRLEDYHAH